MSAGFTQVVLEDQAIAQSWIANVKLEIEFAGLAHARGKREVMSPKHNLLMRHLETSSILENGFQCKDRNLGDVASKYLDDAMGR